MQLIQLVRDDEAVSEVIGVILMVAITVILAAVIAAVVLGIGGETQTTPQSSFSWDWDQGTTTLTITHESGQTIKETELWVRGDTGGTPARIDDDWGALGGSTSAEIGSTSAVASGDSLELTQGSDGVTSSYELRVIWQPLGGETSATLGEDTGPDA